MQYPINSNLNITLLTVLIKNSIFLAIIPAYNESHNIQKIITETSESMLL